jgi:hypothetical protein
LRSHQLLSYLRISHILWSPKVHYRAHNSPPLVPSLSQTNPVHTSLFYLSKIHFIVISSQLRFGLPSVCFLLAFPPKPYIHSASAPCVLHAHALGVIILIIFGEQYTLRSSSLCSFHQTPIIHLLYHFKSTPTSFGTFEVRSCLYSYMIKKYHIKTSKVPNDVGLHAELVEALC